MSDSVDHMTSWRGQDRLLIGQARALYEGKFAEGCGHVNLGGGAYNPDSRDPYTGDLAEQLSIRRGRDTDDEGRFRVVLTDATYRRLTEVKHDARENREVGNKVQTPEQQTMWKNCLVEDAAAEAKFIRDKLVVHEKQWAERVRDGYMSETARADERFAAAKRYRGEYRSAHSAPGLFFQRAKRGVPPIESLTRVEGVTVDAVPESDVGRLQLAATAEHSGALALLAQMAAKIAELEQQLNAKRQR